MHRLDRRFHTLLPLVADRIQQQFGITSPTSLQKSFIKSIVSGDDTFIKQSTGMGKSFGVACAVASMNSPSLILVPSKALALQYKHWIETIEPKRIVNVLCRDGQQNKSKTKTEKSNDIVIATPGKLLDLQLMPMVHRCIVDEADALLKGAERKGKKRNSHKPELMTFLGQFFQEKQNRQIIGLSATLSGKAMNLICGLKKSKGVKFFEDSTIPSDIQHFAYICRNEKQLMDKARELFDNQSLVFVSSSISGANSAADLQIPETKIMKFNLARGIDTKNVKTAIVIGLPSNFKDYQHVAGRVKRLGCESEGVRRVICLLTKEERDEYVLALTRNGIEHELYE